MLATQEEMKEGKLPEESFYYSKQRNFVIISALVIVLCTVLYTFIQTYETVLDTYYRPVYNLLILLKEQHITTDSIYFVPIIFTTLLLASIVIFILIRIIYYGKQLLETKPQLRFTHEGLQIEDGEILTWKDITKLEVTSSTSYSPRVHDYVIQKFLHVHFFSTAQKDFPISDLANNERIEKLVSIYNTYYKKVGDKKVTRQSSPILQLTFGVVLMIIIIVCALYLVQPLLLESFFRQK
jgi:ABC-type uncharacterized transport system fused permease/ATPase subunit